MDLRKLAEDAKKPIDTEPKFIQREQVWSIRYTSPEGVKYEGSVASRVMTGDERFQSSRIAADVAGRPWATLPPGAQLHAASLGVISVQLRNPPEWLLSHAAEDEELAAQLYASCREHDARWFSGNRGAGEGDSSHSRVSIDPVGIATASDIHDTSAVAEFGAR
jgi:hypothetical protein